MAEENGILEAGERIPNFSLDDQSGELLEFYTTMINGGAIVLVVLANQGKANTSMLLALEEKISEFSGPGTHLLVISKDSIEANAALSQKCDLHFPLLSDPGKVIVDWFLVAAQAHDVAVLVLDPNQRLISFQTEADGEAPALISHALGEVKRIAPQGEPKMLSSVAPVLVIPNVFSPAYCRELMDLWQTGGNEQAPISSSASTEQGREVDYGVFVRKDHTIVDQQRQIELTNILGSRIGPELQKIHYYDNLMFEPYVIGCYDAADAGFFRAHRDNFNENLQHRRYAFSINLNTDEYEGGNLRFPEYGHDLYRGPSGCAVLFSCSVMHEVLPVTKGRRFIFQGFIGEKPQQ